MGHRSFSHFYILNAWAEQKAVREIMVFLHTHGVGTARAVRIFKTYGSDAIRVMSENPYRLARDIRGIGFKTADAIAMKLGIEKIATIRVRAGISYALTEAMEDVVVYQQRSWCHWPRSCSRYHSN
jgi:exodeoxyribonuclease V alpha subunit